MSRILLVKLCFLLIIVSGNICKSNMTNTRKYSQTISDRLKKKSGCDSVKSLDRLNTFSLSETQPAAEATSRSVGRSIQTHYLFVSLVLVFVITICFMVVAIAGTIIGLVDCLYDLFMDEESSSTAEATAIKESSSTDADATAATAAKTATSAEESSSTAKATATKAAAEATPCQCALFRYSIYHRR